MSTGCSREAFSLSTKSCWTYRAGVHIGHCRGRQPGHSEKSRPLAEDVNGPAAAGVAHWGALCKEGMGRAETL